MAATRTARSTTATRQDEESRMPHGPDRSRRITLTMLVMLVMTAGLLALRPAAAGAQTPAHQHAGPPAAAPAPLTLADLERMALAHNPTIAQAQADVRAAAGRKDQAGLYPNPEVGYEAREISGAPTMNGGEHGFFIQQPIVTAGKLRLSRAVFAEEQAQAESVAASQRDRVLTGIRLGFYEALGAQQLVALRRQLAHIAADAVTTSQQLLNVGQADQPDVLEAMVDAQRAALAVTDAERDQARIWLRLAAMAGNPSLPLAPLAGSLETGLPQVDRAAALQTILRDSPEVKAAEQNVARARLGLERARVEKYPDIVVRGGLEYNRQQVDGLTRPIGWVGMAEVGVQVPIFDRNQGNIAAATAELTHAERELDRVKLALTADFAGPYETYASDADAVRRYRTSILPQARQAYELYLQKYRQMAAAYPQVLVAQRTLFQLREDYLHTLVELWRAAIEIKGYLRVNGLAAPLAPGEPATVSPGVEVSTPRQP